MVTILWGWGIYPPNTPIMWHHPLQYFHCLKDNQNKIAGKVLKNCSKPCNFRNFSPAAGFFLIFHSTKHQYILYTILILTEKFSICHWLLNIGTPPPPQNLSFGKIWKFMWLSNAEHRLVPLYSRLNTLYQITSDYVAFYANIRSSIIQGGQQNWPPLKVYCCVVVE